MCVSWGIRPGWWLTTPSLSSAKPTSVPGRSALGLSAEVTQVRTPRSSFCSEELDAHTGCLAPGPPAFNHLNTGQQGHVAFPHPDSEDGGRGISHSIGSHGKAACGGYKTPALTVSPRSPWTPRSYKQGAALQAHPRLLEGFLGQKSRGGSRPSALSRSPVCSSTGLGADQDSYSPPSDYELFKSRPSVPPLDREPLKTGRLVQ